MRHRAHSHSGVKRPHELRAGQVNLIGQRAERPRLGYPAGQELHGSEDVPVDDAAGCSRKAIMTGLDREEWRLLHTALPGLPARPSLASVPDYENCGADEGDQDEDRHDDPGSDVEVFSVVAGGGEPGHSSHDGWIGRGGSLRAASLPVSRDSRLLGQRTWGDWVISQVMSRRRVVRDATNAAAAAIAAIRAVAAANGRASPPLRPWAGPKAALPSLAPARVVAAV